MKKVIALSIIILIFTTIPSFSDDQIKKNIKNTDLEIKKAINNTNQEIKKAVETKTDTNLIELTGTLTERFGIFTALNGQKYIIVDTYNSKMFEEIKHSEIYTIKCEIIPSKENKVILKQKSNNEENLIYANLKKSDKNLYEKLPKIKIYEIHETNDPNAKVYKK